MKRLLKKLESKILTKLFTRWIDREYDIELLEMTRMMIENRENDLKWIVDKLNHKPIKGFGH